MPLKSCRRLQHEGLQCPGVRRLSHGQVCGCGLHGPGGKSWCCTLCMLCKVASFQNENVRLLCCAVLSHPVQAGIMALSLCITLAATLGAALSGPLIPSCMTFTSLVVQFLLEKSIHLFGSQTKRMLAAAGHHCGRHGHDDVHRAQLLGLPDHLGGFVFLATTLDLKQ